MLEKIFCVKNCKFDHQAHGYGAYIQEIMIQIHLISVEAVRGEHQLRGKSRYWRDRAKGSKDRTDRRSRSLNTVPTSKPRNVGTFDRTLSYDKLITSVDLPLFKTNYSAKVLPSSPDVNDHKSFGIVSLFSLGEKRVTSNNTFYA